MEYPFTFSLSFSFRAFPLHHLQSINTGWESYNFGQWSLSLVTIYTTSKKQTALLFSLRHKEKAWHIFFGVSLGPEGDGVLEETRSIQCKQSTIPLACHNTANRKDQTWVIFESFFPHLFLEVSSPLVILQLVMYDSLALWNILHHTWFHWPVASN